MRLYIGALALYDHRQILMALQNPVILLSVASCHTVGVLLDSLVEYKSSVKLKRLRKAYVGTAENVVARMQSFAY